MVRPRIGITRALHPVKPAGDIPGYYEPYHARVCEAGGEPVDLRPGSGAPLNILLDGVDGVLIPGGADINPARYGQASHPETAGINDALDELELPLIAAALERDLPVLAICRGQQALNVACGGQLLQHIDGDGHRAHEGGESRFHDVTIMDGSRLGRLLGRLHARTNSRHHQAVTCDSIAPGFTVTACSDDGVVEAMESSSHRWVVAVQWHPERDEVKDDFRPLFDDFVRAAAMAPASARASGA